MGVACPHLSDEPSYTMVESSGGSCRCACQEEFQDPLEQPSGCCSPHVFTSILLGILSCVLMTGGVFLAFHRWDPMWLMVSGIGVVLIIIGTILHCCNSLSQRPKRHPSAGKGCCSRPIPPDHSGHMIANNGSLTEQLLPLSNARSVSQLSLNMLPGYFPPVVTAYGIEQHSAVVQNINRLVQQQQQQPASPQSPGSISQGVAGNAGKSFIVLSLPGDASAANIQNLVATVYQLDGNNSESTANEALSNITPNVVSVVKPNSTVPLILKNAEVQTCNVWPVPVASGTSVGHSVASCSSTTDESILQQAAITEQPIMSPSASCGSTQTDEILPTAEITDLIDCSTNVSPPLVCDNPPNVCDNPPTENNALVNIPPPSSTDLDVPSRRTNQTITAAEYLARVFIDVPSATSTDNSAFPSTLTTNSNSNDGVLPTSNAPTSTACPEVLVDISEDSNADINSNTINPPLLESLVVVNGNNNFQQVNEPAQENAVAVASSDNLIELPQDISRENTNSNLQNLNPEMLSDTSNLSVDDTEIDDRELMDRSSPPPSYEDVTLEGENVGAFGLAYGTI